MGKVSAEKSMDTVSSIGSGETLSPLKGRGTDFDYTHFCKQILKETKRKINAGFLVPLKMYHDKSITFQKDFLSELGNWMDAFCKREGNIDNFWVYMTYTEGYKNMSSSMAGTSPEQIIPDHVKADAQTYMADVSKLEKAQYIIRLCKRRDDVECWILRVYEITLSRMYTADNMSTKMYDVIKYLKDRDMQVDMPIIASQTQNDEPIFHAAANLFLLAIRLHLGIMPKEAVRWYKSGNVAFSRYRDQMLEEFTYLNSLYFCQSYERYLKMQEIARNNKNKYAAKEVGDILRLGMELQDSHGNRIFVEPDGEMACEYYRICIDANYIPAYVPALKTGALIDARQKEELLRTALEEKAPESLAYHVERLLSRADELLHTEQDSALQALRDAADALISLEDTYGEKHVLKAALLQTQTFQKYNSLDRREPELDNNLRELYSVNLSGMREDAVLAEAERAYLWAKKCGFYEAEYRLGILFSSKDKIKSEGYFEQGANKGCRWCKLEYANMRRQQEPQKWLSSMMELGHHMRGDNALQTALAECWIDAKDVLTKVVEGQIKLEDTEIAEIYVQINSMYHNIYNQKETGSKIDKAIELCSKLKQCKDEIEILLKKNKA